MDVTDRNVDTINIDDQNTVASLRRQLSRVFSLGSLDGGFPIVTRADMSHTGPGGLKMIGYISHNELEHALSACILRMVWSPLTAFHSRCSARRARCPSTISCYPEKAT